MFNWLAVWCAFVSGTTFITMLRQIKEGSLLGVIMFGIFTLLSIIFIFTNKKG